MAGDKTYISDNQGKLHRATRVHAVTPTQIVWSSNPNDYTVQVMVGGKWHRAVLTLDANAASYFDNINIDKALVVGDDGKQHSALIVKPETTVNLSSIKTDIHGTVAGTTTGETAVSTYSEAWSNVQWQDNINVYKVLVTGSDGKVHTALLTTGAGGGSVDVIVLGTSPLSLDDAIANSLQYVKAFGGTEQRNLPDGYMQRQFIYMMDESYIDTGIVPDNAGKIEIDFQTTSVQTRNSLYLGARSSTSTGAGFSAAHTNTKEGVFDAFGQRFSPTQTFDNNTRYLISYDNGTIVWKSGSTVIYTNTSTPTDTTTHSLYINALNNAGTVYGNYEGIYLYSFKVWNAQGVLVADYVPAVQKGAVPVVGFYDTVSKTFKTPTAGTFAAGGEAVPTPDTPMDIVSNNGVLRLVPNLWSVYENAYLDANGAAVALSGFGCTDYIPVNAGEKYSFYADVFENYASNGLRICFYDTDKTFIPPRQGDNATTAAEYLFIGTAPANAKYMRCSCGTNSSWIRNIMLKKGVWTTSTIKTAVYTDGTVETIGIRTRNLFDGVIEQGALNTSSGQPQDSTVRVRSANYTAVQPSTTYTLSATITDNIKMGRVFFYQSDGTFIGKTNVWENLPVTFTTPSNAAKVLFVLSSSASGSTIVPSDAQNVQLEQGSTATTYEPYYNGGTATAEMLLSLGDYTDEQEIISGAVTRKLGVKVLDGTEDWELQNASRSVFVIKTLYPADFASNPDNNIGLCTHFTVTARSTTVSNALEDGQMGWNTAGYLVMRRLASLGEVANFKQYLADQYAAGTPVIIVYPLATETTDTVTGQPMNTTAGDNILEITQASLSNLELEAKYKKSA